jgi:pimeloyl-ACP methyl ester carboxylesterase
MIFLWIGLAVVLLLSGAALGLAYYCYRKTFFFDRRIPRDPEAFDLPQGTVYEPFYDVMLERMKQTRALPHRDYSIKSFDGLTLWGTFYEHQPGAPIELMFHGYKGSGERDLCGGVQRCFAMGHSAFIVDQRGSTRSEGKICSFGINERRDCHSWIQFLIKEFGKDVKIILTGVSMGAATVMMAASEPLPPNVKCILADCGYSSPGQIIRLVIDRQGLPSKQVYPFMKLGARIFGHFDLEETSPREAMAKCTVPVIFFHGGDDDFVPSDMSQQNYDACQAPKVLSVIPGAGHCLGCLVDTKGYLETLGKFYDSVPGLRA